MSEMETEAGEKDKEEEEDMGRERSPLLQSLVCHLLAQSQEFHQSKNYWDICLHRDYYFYKEIL